MFEGLKKNGRADMMRKVSALLLTLIMQIPLSVLAQQMGGVSSGMSSAMGGSSMGVAGTSSKSASSLVNGGDSTPLIMNPAIMNTGQADVSALLQKNVSEKDNVTGKEAKQTIVEDKAINEFQDFVTQSIGQKLSMYGHNLFSGATSTFAPVDNIPVTPDYPIGPGDEIIIKGWGTVDIDFRAVVNRNGEIDLPKVGSVNVAGIRYQELQGYLKNAIGRVFRNFELNVTLGKLRSIQVFVVGQARRPGVYTISSLSTLVNTLFASGGPSVKGSMRHIQVKRNGKVVTDLDLYELLLKGDKTKDVALLPGDVIFIPPAGQLVAIYGGINSPAIYELKDDKTSLSGLLELAGGLTTTAAGQKVLLERIEERKVRKVDEFLLDKAGLARLVRDGDLVQVLSIGARFDNAVTLRGNVAGPGRYPWKEGMRVKDLIPDMESLIVSDYWFGQNQKSRISISGEGRLHADVKLSIAEINWDYAVIERLKKDDLTTMLIPFNLGKAISGQDDRQNLLLQPGDTITIFSKDDIQVPAAKRNVFVRLEGEINSAGVYQALPGETLRQIVARIGGLTPNSYLFGAELDRESVRVMQQQKLNEMVNRMEEAVNRIQANKGQAAISQEELALNKSQEAAQAALIARFRNVRATGRVVLEIPPESAQLKDLPDFALEDGDRLSIPAKPSVVSVMGMVYNQNTFMYRPGKSVHDYLDQAGGPTRDADGSHMYILRADGSVVSAQNSSSIFNTFSSGTLMPGDAIIVPEMLDKFVLTQELKDWSQIFYQMAMGIAGLKVLGL